MANSRLRAAQVHLAEGSIDPRFGPDGASPSTGQAFGIVTAVTGTSSAVLDGDEAVQFNASDTYRVLDTDSGLFDPASRAAFFAELLRDDTLFSCTGSSGQPATYTPRSEEHTSELQSLMRTSYAVLCLKKKNNTTPITHTYIIN